jgi:LDH2 family malate/lactate/ureidoglycolate dehydrogenase
MQITIEELTGKLAKAAARYVNPDEAGYFARLFVENHIKKFPRMNPLKEALDDLKNWRDAQTRQIQTLAEKPGLKLLDLGGLAPSLKIKEMHDALEQKARANGVASLGFRNSGAIITLGMWADGLAGRGLIGLAMFNGGKGCVTPPGGCKGVLGTNPLAYAVPGADGPFTLDMATSQIPYFQIKNAKEKGETLPPGAAVDDLGRPTTDASLAMDDDGVSNLRPLGGGFKGYGLMLLVEVLTGALVQSLMSHQQNTGWNPPEYGCFMLALDPGGFGDAAGFSGQVAELGQYLKAQPAAEGSQGVSLPGQRSQAKLEAALAAGVLEVDDKLLAELEALRA